MGIRRSSHARYEIWYHFAWGTKYRKKVFKEKGTREEVKQLFREIAGHYDLEIKEMEVLSDHVHCLVSAPPRIAPARIVQILKSVSTKKLFERFTWLQGYYWGGEVWIGGYFMRTVGTGITKERIAEYIEEQSEEEI
ncbi:MAG: hypothetical protein AMJ46_06890 [Latescibacteria bacterium DG_63]|nr:MAG: hypothetical protein AMJ46_06890 [Latescibacteria bacterium DG_63]